MSLDDTIERDPVLCDVYIHRGKVDRRMSPFHFSSEVHRRVNSTNDPFRVAIDSLSDFVDYSAAEAHLHTVAADYHTTNIKVRARPCSSVGPIWGSSAVAWGPPGDFLRWPPNPLNPTRPPPSDRTALPPVPGRKHVEPADQLGRLHWAVPPVVQRFGLGRDVGLGAEAAQDVPRVLLLRLEGLPRILQPHARMPPGLERARDMRVEGGLVVPRPTCPPACVPRRGTAAGRTH